MTQSDIDAIITARETPIVVNDCGDDRLGRYFAEREREEIVRKREHDIRLRASDAIERLCRDLSIYVRSHRDAIDRDDLDAVSTAWEMADAVHAEQRAWRAHGVSIFVSHGDDGMPVCVRKFAKFCIEAA